MLWTKARWKQCNRSTTHVHGSLSSQLETPDQIRYNCMWVKLHSPQKWGHHCFLWALQPSGAEVLLQAELGSKLPMQWLKMGYSYGIFHSILCLILLSASRKPLTLKISLISWLSAKKMQPVMGHNSFPLHFIWSPFLSREWNFKIKSLVAIKINSRKTKAEVLTMCRQTELEITVIWLEQVFDSMILKFVSSPWRFYRFFIFDHRITQRIVLVGRHF